MDDSSGALVGWRSFDLGSRLALTLQRVNKPPPHDPEDVHADIFVLDKQQAVQLGHFLFQMAGTSAPVREKSSLFGRLFVATPRIAEKIRSSEEKS